MEIRITTRQILRMLQIISWIIFIGLCIEAGAIIVNTGISLFINPSGVKNFWEGADYLTQVYSFDKGHFIVITLSMIIVAVLKAIMFYHIVKLFVDKKLDLAEPFNVELRTFLFKLSYLAFGIGLFSHAGYKYSEWLSGQGIAQANLQSLHIAGADVWIFMAIILSVIVQIIKRGIEIQTENHLTI